MFNYEYRSTTSAGRVCLELSLKPFGYDKSLEGIEKVCRDYYKKWAALLEYATGCSVLLWTSDGSESEIECFDAEALTFTLKEGKKLTPGDEFMIYSDVSAPWNIHDNIIDDCDVSIDLDTEAGRLAILRNNIIHN